MKHNPRGKHKRHRRWPLKTIRNVISVMMLSLAFVSGVALLSRAELRLAGAPVDAQGKDCEWYLRNALEVRLMSEREEHKIYLLSMEKNDVLVHFDRYGEQWVCGEVEPVHR